MMTRDMATRVVRLLESTLDSLLRAHVLVEHLPGHRAAEEMENLWSVTAQVSSWLAGIDEHYPDLTGPDRLFRGASIDEVEASAETDTAKVRVKLRQASEQVAAATLALDQAPGPTTEDRTELEGQLARVSAGLQAAIE